MKKIFLIVCMLMLVFLNGKSIYGYPPDYEDHTQVVDCDIDDDGSFDITDVQRIINKMYSSWPYDSEMDLNGDFHHDITDVNIMVDHFLHNFHDHLSDFDIRYNGWPWCVWKSGVKIVIVNPDETENYLQQWLNIKDLIPSYQYDCARISLDTYIAAYRDIGFGRVAVGESIASGNHAYNMLFTGGDFTDLCNWLIYDNVKTVGKGKIIGNACDPNLSPRYQTERIIYYTHKQYGQLKGKLFWVSYPSQYVNPNAVNCRFVKRFGKEPVPSYFNKYWNGHAN